MQVRAGRIARAAREADRLPLGNALPTTDLDAAQVGVERLVAVAVVDGDRVAVAAGGPSGEDHHARIRRPDRLAHSGADIDCQMPRPVIVARNPVVCRGPDERPRPHRAALVSAGAGPRPVHAGGNPGRAARDDRHDPLLELALPAGDHHPLAGFHLRVGQVDLVAAPAQNRLGVGFEFGGYLLEGVAFLPLVVHPVHGRDFQLHAHADGVRVVLEQVVVGPQQTFGRDAERAGDSKD